MEENNPPDKGDLSGISTSLIHAQSLPKEHHSLWPVIAPIPASSWVKAGLKPDFGLSLYTYTLMA